MAEGYRWSHTVGTQGGIQALPVAGGAACDRGPAARRQRRSRHRHRAGSIALDDQPRAVTQPARRRRASRVGASTSGCSHMATLSSVAPDTSPSRSSALSRSAKACRSAVGSTPSAAARSSTSALTRSGTADATCSATAPPPEEPTTAQRPMPRWSSNRTTSSACENGTEVNGERPYPRKSAPRSCGRRVGRGLGAATAARPLPSSAGAAAAALRPRGRGEGSSAQSYHGPTTPSAESEPRTGDTSARTACPSRSRNGQRHLPRAPPRGDEHESACDNSRDCPWRPGGRPRSCPSDDDQRQPDEGAREHANAEAQKNPGLALADSLLVPHADTEATRGLIMRGGGASAGC